MVAGRDFFKKEINGLNGGLWCQSSNALANDTVGKWTFPDGSKVYTSDSSGYIHMEMATGQVALLRDGPIGEGTGMYTCTIADASGNHTLVVFIAGNADYDSL